MLVQSGCNQSGSGTSRDGVSTYVDAPAEGRDALPDNGVLVDGEDFRVFKDAEDVGCDRRELEKINQEQSIG